MGGTNPYIKQPEIQRPTKKFNVNFASVNVIVEVDPAKIPYGDTGLPGSLLDIALGNGVDIDHACGGVAACSTCHVYVKTGSGSCSRSTENEQDMLDLAPALKHHSRLSCQCVPNGTEDLIVEIPLWNRNLAREGRH